MHKNCNNCQYHNHYNNRTDILLLPFYFSYTTLYPPPLLHKNKKSLPGCPEAPGRQ